jgi:hypothetical protein
MLYTMGNQLRKYKLGLGVLLLFAVAITVVVLVQASSTKADTQTNNTASSIADTLNTYVDSNSVIPDSLAQAGVKNVPSAVSYQKISNSSYKFCVTYKGNSSGFDATGVVSNLVTGSLGTGSGASGIGNTDLFIDSTYHKGANCQTVTPSYITPQPQPCLGLRGAPCVNGGNPTTTTLCDYGPVETGGCSLHCSTTTPGAVAGTAPKVVDGTVSNISGSGSSLVLTVQDAKNVTYTVSVTTSTGYYDSSCSSLDPSNVQSGDEVRVSYPSAINNHVVASEIDDLSW